jgi:adenine phosphoribosyltransferase
MIAMDLKRHITDVPDWPKPGVSFKDITPLLNNPMSLAMAVELMVSPFRGQGVQIVAGAESRGFIFGTALAQTLSAGFVPIRKPRKLPRATHMAVYDLEYGTDELHVHQDAIKPGQRVLLADDVLATGGTMKACCDLVHQLGGHLIGMTFLIELTFLKGREKLQHVHRPIHSVIRY